jgi:hypothetical protein
MLSHHGFGTGHGHLSRGVGIFGSSSHVGNIIKACQILRYHILALELDMVIFEEVIEPLVRVPIPKAKNLFVPLDGHESLVHKHSKRNLHYE